MPHLPAIVACSTGSKSCPLLGLTATPVRMAADDDRRLWNMFKEIIYEISKKTLSSRMECC